CNRYPKLGRAIGLRDMLQDILADEDQETLRWWCKRAKLSRLQPFRELAGSIQEHWSGVVAFLKLDLPMVRSRRLTACSNLPSVWPEGFVPCVTSLSWLISKPPAFISICRH
ncbi:MAG TPA: transposase, partial [Terrimicrobiaceae bacterium]